MDCFVEAIEIDASLDTAERLALASAFPEWTFTAYKCKQGRFYNARKVAGKFETRISAGSWKELAGKVGA